MKQAVLLLKRRESNRPGQFRPKSDQEGLLYRGMGYLSGQPTKLSGDFERKKCRDPFYIRVPVTDLDPSSPLVSGGPYSANAFNLKRPLTTQWTGGQGVTI